MTNNQAVDIFILLRGKFADWKPESEEAMSWKKMLRGMPFDAANAAVQPFWESWNYKTPKPKAFREAVALAAPSNEKWRGDSGPYEGAYFVQCAEAPKDTPSKLGHFEGSYYPKRLPPEHIQRTQATEAAQRFENTYGGKWVVYEAASRQAMVEQQRKEQGNGT